MATANGPGWGDLSDDGKVKDFARIAKGSNDIVPDLGGLCDKVRNRAPDADITRAADRLRGSIADGITSSGSAHDPKDVGDFVVGRAKSDPTGFGRRVVREMKDEPKAGAEQRQLPRAGFKVTLEL